MSDFVTMPASGVMNGAVATSSSKAGHHTRTIAVTSGKNGVGKTNFIVNVALELAMYRRNVTLVSADNAALNAGRLLGLNPLYHIGHVLEGRCKLGDIIGQAARGIRFIAGQDGVDEMARPENKQQTNLISTLEAIEHESDFMFIDTAAGVANNVMNVLCAASEVVVVTVPEPTAVMDAYATIKILHKHNSSKPIWIVVNNVIGIRDGEEVFKQLQTVTTRFLNHPIQYLGAIPQDADMAKACDALKPIIEYAPNRPASRSFRVIAKYLDDSSQKMNGSINSFWSSLTEIEE